MKRIALKDIAKIAGVSASTVSLILNGRAKELRISEALERRIKNIARKSGYSPNHLAVSLRKGETKIIGLVVENIAGNFFAAVSKIIDDEADKHGYKVVYCSTENDTEKAKGLIKMLNQRQVDGYIITPVPGIEKEIADLVAHHKPVVLLDSYFTGLNVAHVLVDNTASVTLGINYLLKKGFTKIGFVTVDLDLIQIKQRKDAFIKTMKANKIKIDTSAILEVAYNATRSETVERIKIFIDAHKELQVLFFATNYLGVAGLEAMQLLRKTIAKDIALMCFDDNDIFKLYPPGITALEQPVEAIAKTAADLLFKQLGKNKINFEKD